MIIIRAYHERKNKNKDLCLIYNLSHGQTRVYSIPLDSVTYKVEIRTKMALLILLQGQQIVKEYLYFLARST